MREDGFEKLCGEITQNRWNKGEALLFLAGQAGVPIQDTIAIGDSENDLEMLEAAGLGIAMGNAGPGVKRAAGEVTLDVGEDGVYAAFLAHALTDPYPDPCGE